MREVENVGRLSRVIAGAESCDFEQVAQRFEVEFREGHVVKRMMCAIYQSRRTRGAC